MPTAAAPQRDRRDAILQAAAELLGRVGVAQANLRDIARQAGISNGTLHYYYPSKDELLDELILKAVAPLYDHACTVIQGEDHPRLQLRAIVQHSYEAFDSNPQLYQVAVTLGDQLRVKKPKQFQSATKPLTTLVRRGQETGDIREGSAELLAIYCHGVILRVQPQVFGELKEPLVKHIDDVVEACWRILKP